MATLSGKTLDGILLRQILSQITTRADAGLTGEHNRWRCRVTSVSVSDDQVAFSEIEMFTEASLSRSVSVNWNGEDYTNTYVASSEYSVSYQAHEAFNETRTVDGWVSAAADEVGAWVEVNHEIAQEIVGIHVWFSASAVGNDSTPLQFVLEFYDEEVSDWVVKLTCDVPIEAQSADWDGSFWYAPYNVGDIELIAYAGEGEMVVQDAVLIELPLYESTGLAHEEAAPVLPAYEGEGAGVVGVVGDWYGVPIELPFYEAAATGI